MSDDQTAIAEITVDEVASRLGSGALLLDVREDDEWAAGHAGDAVHIPLGAVADRRAELPAGRTVLCICRMGGRSLKAAALLSDVGYEVANVAGGMQVWESSGRPVVTDDGGAGRVI